MEQIAMNLYLQLTLIGVVTIYIVDVSGFTQSWRSFLESKLSKGKPYKLRRLPPFDCSTCMVWWVTIIYALAVGKFSLLTLGFSTLLSYLSITISQLMLFIREILQWIINKLMP